MRIKIINPNTCEDMTRSIEATARKYARQGTEIVAVSAPRGPISIEDFYDEALAAVGVMEEVRKGLSVSEGFEGYIIACFGDPGLYACREMSEAPVIGIAEASLFMACMLGHKFSILSILKRFEAAMEELVKKYGLESRCASVRCTDVAVVDFEKDREKAKDALLKAGRQAIEEDGAEVLCLGCAGMVGFDKQLEKELKVPVIDPVVAAVKMIEGIIDYGGKTSKILTFRFPEKKDITGFAKVLEL
ncbi:aspartate/glutamate racemase family protein [Dehalococcoidia bacterium]|nr:aspartate/glutamate racemase family protein [Dehalococcoidia bacterium]